jgi:hypothetical protein
MLEANVQSSYPRDHPEVQKSLFDLLMMIRWQPTHGDLFTAQTPLFAIFIAATVALTDDCYEVDNWAIKPSCEMETPEVPPPRREMVKDWFKATMDSSRGVRILYLTRKHILTDLLQNVKPIWDVIQEIWKWQDETYNVGGRVSEDPLLVHPWWEDMVGRLVENFGRPNLA